MAFLNAQIAALAKKKKSSLVRKQISCGIFQEVDSEVKRLSKENKKSFTG